MVPISQNPLTSTPMGGRARSPRPSNADPEANSVNGAQSRVLGQGGANGHSEAVTRRNEEKNQLCDLNNRLAAYIENVNRLQSENFRLNETLRRVEATKTTETTTVKHNFQRETDKLRAVISEEAKLRATAQAEAKESQKIAERVTALNATLKEDLMRASHRLNNLETENANLRTKYETAAIQTLQKQKELDEARKRAVEAEDHVKTLSIKNATLVKEIDGLNRVNKFMTETHEKHIEEIRNTSQSEIVEASSRVRDRVQSNLKSQVEEFRRIYEIKMNEQRANFDQEKERLLAQYVPKQTHELIREEAAKLAAKVSELKKEVENKKNLLEQERLWSSELVRSKDREIQESLERYRNMKAEYDSLLCVQQGLHKELDVFRLLMEDMESHANLTGSGTSGYSSCSSASPTTNVRSGEARTTVLSSQAPPFGLVDDPMSGNSTPEDANSRKRKRESVSYESTQKKSTSDLETTHESSGPISIADHDAQGGKFIILENTSDRDLPLGRWKIVQRVGKGEKVSHRFPLQFTIKAKDRVVLWSANSGKKHCPPGHYVLKKIVFPWGGPGNAHLSTTVLDPRGRLMAKRVTRMRSSSSGSAQKSQRVDEEESSSDDDQTDPDTLDESGSPDESNCCLM